MANNLDAVITAASRGLSQVVRDMRELQRALHDVQTGSQGAAGAQNSQADASRRQARDANDASESLGRLNNQHTNTSRQMSELSKSSSAAIAIAYAEIAATVFTLSAAFNFLKDSAQYENMLQSQRLFARETGVNLSLVASVLQKASKEALNFNQAASMASIGKTAGFSIKQVENLAKVSRTAATILGRDVPESIDRAFRGVAKGEPEILDELGIFIRLDKAQQDYAKQFNLKVKELTSLQKVQATYYAFMKSGQTYMPIVDTTEVDALTKAQAAFMTSIKELTTTFTNYVSPFVSYLAQNKDVLMAVSLLFGGSALKSAANAIFNPTAIKKQIEGMKEILKGDAELIAKHKETFTLSVPIVRASTRSAAIAGLDVEAARLSNAISSMGVKSGSAIEKLNNQFLNGTKTAQQFMEAIGKGANSIGSKLNQAAIAGTGKFGGKTVDVASLNAAVAALERYNINLRTSTSATINLANATTSLKAAWMIASVAAESFATKVSIVLASVKWAVASIGSSIIGMMNLAGIAFMVYEAGKAAAHYFNLTKKGYDDLIESAEKSSKAVADSMAAWNKYRNTSKDSVLNNTAEVKAYAGTIEAVSVAVKDLTPKLEAFRESFNPLAGIGITKEAVGVTDADIAKISKVVKQIDSLGNPEVYKVIKQNAASVGLTVKEFYKQLDSGVNREQNIRLLASAFTELQPIMDKMSEKATALSVGLLNVGTNAAAAATNMETFQKGMLHKTDADDTISKIGQIKTELKGLKEAYYGTITGKDANAQETAQRALFAAISQAGIDLKVPQGIMDQIDATDYAAKKYDILNRYLVTLKGTYESLQTKTISMSNSQKAESLALSMLLEKYKYSGADITNYISTLDSLQQKEKELGVLRQKEAATATYDSDTKAKALRQLGIDKVTIEKEIGSLRTKLLPSSTVEDLFGVRNLANNLENAKKAVTELVSIMARKGVSKETQQLVSDTLLSISAVKEFTANSDTPVAVMSSYIEASKKALQDMFGKMSEYSSLLEQFNLVTGADTKKNLLDQLDKVVARYQKIYDLEVSRASVTNAIIEKQKSLIVDMDRAAATSADKVSLMQKGFESNVVDAILQFKASLVDVARSTARTTTGKQLDTIQAAGGNILSLPNSNQAEYAALIKNLNNPVLDKAGKQYQAYLLQEGVLREELLKSAEKQATAEVHLSDSTIRAIVKTTELTSAQNKLIESYQKVNDTITDMFKDIASGKSFSETGNLLRGKLKTIGTELIGRSTTSNGKALQDMVSGFTDKMKAKFASPDMLKSFGKFGDIMKGMPSVLGPIASILSGDTHGGVGQLLGGAAGALVGLGPLGAIVGGMLGSSIGKKVLKEIGVQAQVTADGIVTAQDIEYSKKKGLLGSKAITDVIGTISSDASLALQDSITKIRSGFVSNITQLGVLSKGALTANLADLAKFTYSGRFMVAAGSDTSTLYTSVSKGYGDALAKSLTPFIEQFKIASESLTDTLSRLVSIVKTTDATFSTVFFKGTGKGISNLFSTDYLKGIAKSSIQGNMSRYTGTDYTTNLVNSVILKPFSDFVNGISTSISNAIDTTYLSENMPSWAVDAAMQFIPVERAKFAQLNDIYIKFLSGNATDLEVKAMKEIARIDFYNKIYASMEGATNAEKQATFDTAMQKYGEAVSSSLEILSNQFSNLALELESTSGLPASVKAASNGVITPIIMFNEQLKTALNNGASPAEIAVAIQTGAKLSDVIKSVLDVFSSINISSISTKADFLTNMMVGISDTFKSSLLDQFKKTLVAPILSGILSGTGDSGLSAATIATAGASLSARATELINLANNPSTKAAMSAVGTEFEKLMSLFGSLDIASTLKSLADTIKGITIDLKQSAFDFLVGGDAYSSMLFKISEELNSVGLSSQFAGLSLTQVFAKVTELTNSGVINASNLDTVTQALKDMAEATKLARTRIEETVSATGTFVTDVLGNIKSIAISIAQKAGDVSAAKEVFNGLLQYPADQLAKAREVYRKAVNSGDMLAIAKAGSSLNTALSTYMNDQLSYQDNLKTMIDDKYNAEKDALQNILDLAKQLSDYAKELKYDEKLSILKPIDRLADATKTFDQLQHDLLTKAASSTLTAEDIKSIQDDSKLLLTLGRDVYASSDKYTMLYNQVQSLLAQSQVSMTAGQPDMATLTLNYQKDSLAYSQQVRDIQLSALNQLQLLSENAAYTNAISVQMLDAIRFNQGMPSGVVLSDYYNSLLQTAQSGTGTFTTINTGFPNFTQGTALNQNTDSATAPSTTDLNTRLVGTLERLEMVLSMLPLDMKNAILSKTTATARN